MTLFISDFGCSEPRLVYHDLEATDHDTINTHGNNLDVRSAWETLNNYKRHVFSKKIEDTKRAELYQKINKEPLSADEQVALAEIDRPLFDSLSAKQATQEKELLRLAQRFAQLERGTAAQAHVSAKIMILTQLQNQMRLLPFDSKDLLLSLPIPELELPVLQLQKNLNSLFDANSIQLDSALLNTLKDNSFAVAQGFFMAVQAQGKDTAHVLTVLENNPAVFWESISLVAEQFLDSPVATANQIYTYAVDSTAAWLQKTDAQNFTNVPFDIGYFTGYVLSSVTVASLGTSTKVLRSIQVTTPQLGTSESELYSPAGYKKILTGLSQEIPKAPGTALRQLTIKLLTGFEALSASDQTNAFNTLKKFSANQDLQTLISDRMFAKLLVDTVYTFANPLRTTLITSVLEKHEAYGTSWLYKKKQPTKKQVYRYLAIDLFGDRFPEVQDEPAKQLSADGQ